MAEIFLGGGWDAIERRLSVWIVVLKIWIGKEFILQTLGGGAGGGGVGGGKVIGKM